MATRAFKLVFACSLIFSSAIGNMQDAMDHFGKLFEFKRCDTIVLTQKVIHFKEGRTYVILDRPSQLDNMKGILANTRCLFAVTEADKALETVKVLAAGIRTSKTALVIADGIDERVIEKPLSIHVLHVGKDTPYVTCPGAAHLMLLRPGLTCPTAAIALRGQNLSVAFVGPKPYIIESEGSSSSSSPVGSDVDLIKFLARHFEFDFSLHRAFTFDWRRFKNGTSYGITYRVGTGLNDLGIGQLGLLPHRARHVDYLPYMHRYEFLLASAKPVPVAKYNTILREFDAYMWAGIGLSVVATTIWLILEDCARPTGSKDSAYRGIALTTGTLLQQSLPQGWFGASSKPKQFLLAVWLLAAVFISLSYKSTLLSGLIQLEYRRPVDSLSDLLRSGLPLLLPRGTVPMRLMATDPRPVVQKIYNRSVVGFEYNGTMPKEGIQKRDSGEGVMILTNLARDLFVNDAHFGEVLSTSYSSFVVPKGSPLMVALGGPVRWLKDTGIVDKMKRDAMRPDPLSPRPRVRRDEALTPLQLAPTFILLAGGIFASVVAFLREWSTA